MSAEPRSGCLACNNDDDDDDTVPKKDVNIQKRFKILYQCSIF